MFAAIVIPNFELGSVLRHEPALHDAPAGLLLEDSKKARLSQITAAAAKSGVSAGMTTTQARARCPVMAFRLRSIPQEEAAMEILLECAYQSAAYIEATAPGVCTLDLRGLPIARDNDAALERWALKAVRRLEAFFLTATVGVAAAPALALQAARVAAPVRCVRDARTFWRALPIQELAPPAELLEVLRQWGIATAGEFMAVGKDRIAERLGAEGAAFFERARADRVRPLHLTAPRGTCEESFEFAEPIEMLEPLLFIVRRLLDQIARRMEQSARVVQRLDLILVLESDERHERTIEIPSPTREVEVLFRIVNNHLENVRTAAPVKALRLRAHPVAAEARQFQLFEAAIRDPNRFFEMIGRVSALLGPDRVGTPRVEPTHRPDDVRLAPVAPGARGLAPLEQLPMRRGLMLRRFRPPLAATVRLRESMPIFVRSSRVSGSVVQSAGPWRASGNWWENPWNREEWDVQTKEGALYRIYRDPDGWFIEGAYD